MLDVVSHSIPYAIHYFGWHIIKTIVIFGALAIRSNHRVSNTFLPRSIHPDAKQADARSDVRARWETIQHPLLNGGS